MPPLEQTLRRLMQRTAMVLQAEKCVFLLYEPETDELVGRLPAFGLVEETVNRLRLGAAEAASGEVFQFGREVVIQDATSDPRMAPEWVALLEIKNALLAPITIEIRDEDGQVVGRRTIGVLHVFNKLQGPGFDDDDRSLLAIMAKQAGAVLRNVIGDW